MSIPPDAVPGSPTPPGGTSGSGAQPGGGADLVGTVLAGRYRILKLLGEGAMGAVYLGEHVRIGRQDAIKVLRGPMARDPEAIARFTRGARNASAIHHPNVCAIYDFSDTSDGLQFMAMEYVPGATLKDVLETEGALPPQRAAWIARQVADALQAAHEADIVHRDLKPGNIMISRGPDGRDRVKVVDFDIAKGPRDGEASEVTRLGFVVGTPEYMSPEQLMGERLDGRSDTYSLALVLFRALTGMLPFQAADVQGLALKRLTDSPLRLDQAAPGHAFPPGLQEVISRGLARSPAERYQSAAEFGRDVLATVGEEAGAAPSGARGAGRGAAPELPATRVAAATAGTAPASAQRSRRLLIAGGGVIVIAAAAGLGLWIRAGGTSTASEGTAVRDTATQVAQRSDSAAPPVAAESTGRGVVPNHRAGPSRTDSEHSNPAPTPKPPPGPAPSAALVVPAADAKAVVGRQQDAVFLATSPLSGSRLHAIGDTLAAAYRAPVDDTTKALAAFVMGNVQAALGDTTHAIKWLEDAVRLRPDLSAYGQLLHAYQKARP